MAELIWSLPMTVTLSDFRDDAPWDDLERSHGLLVIPDQIEGVVLRRLVTHSDGRGDLTVLLSSHYVSEAVTPHVYLVTSKAGSIRGWVYHRFQSDRLALTNGDVRVVLYDLRPQSRTYRALNVLDVGKGNPVLLTIPPLVAHAVQCRGETDAQFVNMPTRAYDPGNPDKARLPWDHPEIPYSFV